MSASDAPKPWAPSVVGVGPGAAPTVGAFLAERFAHIAPAVWAERLAHGLVHDAEGATLRADSPTHAGQRIHYQRDVPNEAPVAARERVVYEDELLLVVDKPHGLPVQPSGPYLMHTVLMRQRQRLGSAELVPAHRIDRDTAGLVLLVKQRGARNAYSAMFRQHAVHKTYLAVAPWVAGLAWPQRRSSRLGKGAHFMQMSEIPGAPNAVTDIDVLAAQGDWALYRLQPLTGQRHQLRVHLAALGLPIRFDGIYPVLRAQGDTDPAQPLQLLAQRLAFTDPISGKPHAFKSQLRLQWPPCPPKPC